MSEEWVERTTRLLNDLKSLPESRDRLEALDHMMFAHALINRSLEGWRKWLNNPRIMMLFTLNELNEFERVFRETAETFLECDLKATRAAQSGEEEKPPPFIG